MTRETKHYVDNKKMLEVLIDHKKKVKKVHKEYKKAIKVAKESGSQIPQVPEKLPMPTYIAECIMKIANNLSRRQEYAGYPCREDMEGDAIENMCQYWENFDPKKSKYPFAYFTQISIYAFWRRIAKEKKQLYAKYKMLDTIAIGDWLEMLHEDSVDPTTKKYLQSPDIYDNISDFISEFEAKQKQKKDQNKMKAGAKKNANTKGRTTRTSALFD